MYIWANYATPIFYNAYLTTAELLCKDGIKDSRKNQKDTKGKRKKIPSSKTRKMSSNLAELTLSSKVDHFLQFSSQFNNFSIPSEICSIWPN